MRPPLLNPLFADVSSLPGVGPGIAKALGRLKLTRVVDLLFHLPPMKLERVPLATLDAICADRIVTVPVLVLAHDPGQGRTPTRVRAADDAGTPLTLVYFADRGGWARKQLPVGQRRIVSGRLELFGERLQIVHPDVAAPEDAAALAVSEPVYRLTEGVPNRRMRGLAAAALVRVPDLPEWIEPSVLARQGWTTWAAALARAHAEPDDARAKARLGYDELLADQLALLLVRQSVRRRRGRPLPGTGALTARFDAALPYQLTTAQRRSGGEIAGDVTQARPMLRLLQGDVGSGKTVVAFRAVLAAVESGAQAALLAPTDLLGRQHLATATRMLAPLGVRVGYLSGREKGRAREDVLAGLAAGHIDLLIGTHAIFQDTVAYHDLGLVVIDEQHKFGVEQRLRLAEKNAVRPHLLVMTATPIPRTLLLTGFGEMDVSRLDERPPGRQPVETRVTSLERLDDVLDGIARHLAAGRQGYWVCPLVEETEAGDIAGAETRAAELRARFGDAVGLVHGRMRGPDKDAAMAAFQSGVTRLLVSTTVIEVGVDVPNATLMVVEQAERFGLAQLHQLRGRVGRGADHSVCLLLRSDTLSETARKRLSLLRESDDGFRIAEADLALRGGGELLGTRQAGEAGLRLATVELAEQMLDVARDDARLLLERDGGLESPRGEAARVLLYLFQRDAAVALLRAG